MTAPSEYYAQFKKLELVNSEAISCTYWIGIAQGALCLLP
jgi:hypothetical protein